MLVDDNRNGEPAPVPSFSLRFTENLLRQYYSTVCTLRELLPIQGGSVTREDDSDSFQRLVGDTVVASRSLTGPPKLTLEENGRASGAAMSETQIDAVNRFQIIEQVQQRLFAAHAKEYYREKKAGTVAFATPKNVFAFGYRLETDRTRQLARTRSQLEHGFVEVFPNTVLASLIASRDWDQLAARVNPDWLIDLFSSPDTALFLPLPNACLMQISGTPVADLRTLEDSRGKLERGSRRTRHRPRKRKRTKKATGENADDLVEQGEESAGVEPDSQVKIPDVQIDAPDATAEAAPDRLAPLGATRSLPSVVLEGAALSTLSTATPFGLATMPVSPTKNSLRPTRSATSVFGASEANERPVKRRRLETLNSNNAVVLSRHQMYHHRLAKGTSGKLPYGLSTKHILVRLPNLYPSATALPVADRRRNAAKGDSEAAARHLAKYVFPRQFGLHNVYTSPKPRASLDVLPDYTDREIEIKRLGSVKTPSRLKPVLPLLQKLAVLSSRCGYRKLLDRRCPSRLKRGQLGEEDQSAALSMSGEPRTQVSRGEVSLDISHASLIIPHGQTVTEKSKKPKLSDYACSVYEVERYVLDCIRDVIPNAFWGSEANRKVVNANIAKMVRYRRFESISVHALLQEFSILECGWLGPASASAAGQRTTAADVRKRHELLSEFIFWLFDSFVIDLIRTAFYVTDSVTHQNRPLYFRQDDWNKLCAPLLKQLGETVFEKVPHVEALTLQRDRELGVSFVRLLPKETGVRPIVNLARRPIKVAAGGRREVGQPINKILQGVFDVLTFEAKRKPHLVGSLVTDSQQIYSKLRLFKKDLQSRYAGNQLPKLYFVKVDVRAAYDTIQQDKLLQIVEGVLQETVYWIQRYSQVSPLAGTSLKAFKRAACTDGELGMFEDLAIKLAHDLHNLILSDTVLYTSIGRDRLMQLLREHITTNLVKVSGRIYRQKTGIPQGSILSSLLCSLFYGDMEKTHFGFTRAEEALLLRYVDDFLFVTTDVQLASRFLRVMDAGLPDYGCAISPEKRLTNFDISLAEAEVVPPLLDGQDFPWCGLLIDTKTLEIRFCTGSSEKDVTDLLTIQRHRKPGRAFLNAMFRAVKIRSRIMYVDTAHNSLATAYGNIYTSLLVVALKFQAYVQEWGIDARRKSAFLYGTLEQVVVFQWSAIVNQSRSLKAHALCAELALKRSWVTWLGFHAFHRVLSRRPGVYGAIATKLQRELRGSKYGGARVHLQKVIGAESMAFADRANGDRKARRL